MILPQEGLTVQVEKGFGVKILRIQTVTFLPHLFQLILTTLYREEVAYMF